MLSFLCASIHRVGPLPRGDQAKVVSARLKPRSGTRGVREVCNFLGSVSLQQKFEVLDQCYSLVIAQVKRWTNVLAQFYLASKGKYILKAWGQANSKGAKRRERLNFGSFFNIFFSSPRACPMYIRLASRAACFTWGSHSSSRTFFCSIFMGFFLSMSFSHHYLALFFLF